MEATLNYDNGGEMVTRIEIIALFSALAKLCEKKDLESVTEVVNEVLQEARKDDRNTKL